MDESPTTFINRERIQWAQQLLSETPSPATRIALEVGFRDASYFYRQFQRHLGCTPKEYRQLQSQTYDQHKDQLK